MKKNPLLLALVGSAAMAMLPSLAAAQSYDRPYDEPTYQQQQDDYQARLRQYNEERAAYDQRQQYRQDQYDSRGYHSRDYNARRDDPCARRSGDAAGGLIVGAVAGAVLGSAIAGRGSHTEGAVIGGVAGGALGASVAGSSNHCDR